MYPMLNPVWFLLEIKILLAPKCTLAFHDNRQQNRTEYNRKKNLFRNMVAWPFCQASRHHGKAYGQCPRHDRLDEYLIPVCLYISACKVASR
jgi:hypothetical protein